MKRVRGAVRGRLGLAYPVDVSTTFTRGHLEIDVRPSTGDDGDRSGWFCVATDPFPCPSPGCSFVARHMTALHRVIVWPERDDPQLLDCAAKARAAGRNPRIVAYERSFGQAVSYYELFAGRDGAPVHGIGGRP